MTMMAATSRRRLLGAGLAAGLALPALGLRAQGRPVLKVGDQKGGLRTLLEAEGRLGDLSYDIQWAEFPAAAPLAEALNAAVIDVGTIGDAPLIFTLAAGTRAKAICAGVSDPYGTAVLVRPDSPFKGAADLKGRSIATNRGSIGHYVALKALDAAGLKASDVQFRFLPPPDAKLALTQGAVDAWATWEPYTALAEIQGHAKVLVSGRGLWSGLGYLAATDAAIAARREPLHDFVRRVARAQVWSYKNVDSFSATMARIIGIPVDVAKLQFVRRDTRWQNITPKIIAEQQRTADFYVQADLLKQRLDVSKTFDTSFKL